MQAEFGVLGPVTAWTGGAVIPLKGPRHRAVLARLLVARGRTVPMATLVADLWVDPPPNAVGALQTFVSALRRALEPERAPRAPARLLVTQGAGYALLADPAAVDAVRFERSVRAARSLPSQEVLAVLAPALDAWRGPAYADFADEPWARAERARLTELRLRAVELQAGARLEVGRAAEAVADLDAHVAEHPWREEGWRLLALALYRTGRQGDASAVLRRARDQLVEQLGMDPGPELRELESDILRQAPHLTAEPGAAARVWTQAATTYDRSVGAGPRARLRSTVDLMRTMAVTGGGGLDAAQRQRLATIRAAEEMHDPELTAGVIGAYDVPALWSRSDHPDQAVEVVAAAERTLAAVPSDAPATLRARLLATIGLETRGATGTRGREAAAEAERIARAAGDPALLAFALNAVFMQSFHRAGLAGRRDAVGVELVDLAGRHGLATTALLGQLVRMQARSALGDFDGAEVHAATADELARRHELPLVGVFTEGFRALRIAVLGQPGGGRGGLPGRRGPARGRGHAGSARWPGAAGVAHRPAAAHGIRPDRAVGLGSVRAVDPSPRIAGRGTPGRRPPSGPHRAGPAGRPPAGGAVVPRRPCRHRRRRPCGGRSRARRPRTRRRRAGGRGQRVADPRPRRRLRARSAAAPRALTPPGQSEGSGTRGMGIVDGPTLPTKVMSVTSATSGSRTGPVNQRRAESRYQPPKPTSAAPTVSGA